MSFIDDIGDFIGDIPVVGEIVESGVEAVRGSATRAAAAAQGTATTSLEQQRQFQAQQTAATGTGLALGNVLNSPVILLFIAVAVFFFLRR